MEYLFCPLVPAWGDWATWVGAVFAGVAAVATIYAARAVKQIADRDFSQREAEKKLASDRVANLTLPEFVSAVYVLKYIGERGYAGEPGGLEGLMLANSAARMRADFLNLSIKDCTHRRDMTSLHPDVVAAVGWAEQRVREAQGDFADGGMHAHLAPWQLVNALAREAREVSVVVRAAASALFRQASPGVPEWEQQADDPELPELPRIHG